VLAIGVATVVTYLGNRYWTYQHRARGSVARELPVFVLLNGVAIGIGALCLAFSHYVLGLTSPLADNLSGNVIGLGLGTLFRFWSYRRFVFTGEVSVPPEDPASGVPGPN
jgi:putative flippase GtrA